LWSKKSEKIDKNDSKIFIRILRKNLSKKCSLKINKKISEENDQKIFEKLTKKIFEKIDQKFF
jgi:hypothetical protein